MDVKPYIESGIIEEYCLGLLPQSQADEVAQLARAYPEILSEIQRIESTLLTYARSPMRSPMKGTILKTLSKLATEEAIDLANPPMLHRHSDFNLWNEALSGVESDDVVGNMKTTIFFKDESFQLCVVWMHGRIDGGRA